MIEIRRVDAIRAVQSALFQGRPDADRMVDALEALGVISFKPHWPPKNAEGGEQPSPEFLQRSIKWLDDKGRLRETAISDREFYGLLPSGPHGDEPAKPGFKTGDRRRQGEVEQLYSEFHNGWMAAPVFDCLCPICTRLRANRIRDFVGKSFGPTEDDMDAIDHEEELLILKALAEASQRLRTRHSMSDTSRGLLILETLTNHGFTVARKP